jgi:hypothetical protein
MQQQRKSQAPFRGQPDFNQDEEPGGQFKSNPA